MASPATTNRPATHLITTAAPVSGSRLNASVNLSLSCWLTMACLLVRGNASDGNVIMAQAISERLSLPFGLRRLIHVLCGKIFDGDGRVVGLLRGIERGAAARMLSLIHI